MFCANCGTKLEDGARFCANCGTAVAQSPAPVAENAAPAAVEQAAPAVESVAAPAFTAAEQAAPAVESVAAPAFTAAEQSAPAVESVAAPTFTAAEQAAPVVESVVAPVMPETPTIPDIPSVPEVPAFESSPASPASPAAPAAPEQYNTGFGQSPEQYNTGFAGEQAAAPVKPVKKKSKAGLIAGLTAGAVVVGGGAVGYFGFHDDITRLFMGNVEYAKMIDKNAFASYAKLGKDADEMTAAASMSFSQTFNTFRTTGNSDIGEEYADKMAKQMLAPLRSLGSGFDMLPEGTSIYADSSVNIKLGSVFAMLDNESTRKIIDGINSLTFKEKLANGETDLMSIGIDDGNGHTGSADLYIKDGSVLITFPGISDKKIYISKEEIDKYTGLDGQQDIKPLDPAEIKRIRSEIAKIYYSAYDSAAITYTDNAERKETIVTSGDEITASAKGTLVEVSFTGEQLKSMFGQISDFLRDDAYLISYATGNLKLSEEEYKKLFDNNNNSSVKLSLVVQHIVDVHNNVLASTVELLPDKTAEGYDADKDDGAVIFTGIEDGKTKTAHLRFEIGGSDKTIDICAGEKASTDTDGIAALCITGENTEINAGIECAYENRAVKKFLGRDVVTGKFTLRLTDPDKFVNSLGWATKQIFGAAVSGIGDALGDITSGGFETDGDFYADDGSDEYLEKTMIEVDQDALGDNNSSSVDPFGDNKAIMDEIKKFTAVCESSIEGDVYTASLDLSLGEIGSFGLRTRTEKKDETVQMPDTVNAIKLDDADAFETLGTDVLTWSKDIVATIDGGDGYLSKTISEAIDKAEAKGKFKKHYAKYDDLMSKYTIGNVASNIYYNLYGNMQELLLKPETPESGIIKLYFRDGKYEVLDDGGLSDLSVLDSYEPDEYSENVYAEIIFDKRAEDPYAGVVTVYTDDPTDIPADLPNVFNFVDGVYPWDDDDFGCEKGEFLVGASPYLEKGTPTTTELQGKTDEEDLYRTEEVNEVNELARDIAYAVNDVLGSDRSLGSSIRTNEKQLSAVFYIEADGSTSEIKFYAGAHDRSFESGYFDEREEKNRPLIDTSMTEKISKSLENVAYRDHAAGYIAALYFLDGKFVGAAAADADADIDFNASNTPDENDFVSGKYYYWQTLNDGTPVYGLYFNYYGEEIPLGTYSVSAYGPLGYDFYAEASTGYDGTWVITAMNGRSLSEYAEENGSEDMTGKLHVIINGVKLMIEYPDGERDEMSLRYGAEYDGKPAAIMTNHPEDEDAVDGYAVFDSKTKGRLISTGDDGNVFDIELESAGGFSDVTAIDAIAGLWEGELNGESIKASISTNYVFSNNKDPYIKSDDYFVMNPGNGCYDLYSYDDEYRYVGTLVYNESDDKIIVTDIISDETVELERKETAPTYDYLGQWTLETYEGMTREEYCEKENVDQDTFTLNLDLGAYSGLMNDRSGWTILTMKQAQKNTFKLAMDSSMFFDCTYDPQTEKITAIFRYDDSDETQTAVFTRGTYAFG